MTAPPTVALYARVSTPKQDELNQVPILTEYAKARGYNVYKVYCDTASGCNPYRPAWRELVADAHAHRFSVVVAVRLDRIMRSVAHLLKANEELHSCGVAIELTDIGRLDMESVSGQLINTILAAIAQWERQIIRERTKQTLDEKRRQGIIGGRPKKDIDIKTAALLRFNGCSIAETARRMGCTRSDINNRRVEIWAEMDRLKIEQENGKGGQQ